MALEAGTHIGPREVAADPERPVPFRLKGSIDVAADLRAMRLDR